MDIIAQLCRAVSSQLRHVSTIGKRVKQLNLLHKSSQYGELRPTNGWDRLVSLAHPSKFQRFCVSASLLQRRRSTEVNQTLPDVWPSPGMLHSIYIFGACCPLTEFCQLKNSLCVQVLRSSILAALVHGTRAVGVIQTLRVVEGMELRNFGSSTFSTEGTTYIPRGPSRWG